MDVTDVNAEKNQVSYAVAVPVESAVPLDGPGRDGSICRSADQNEGPGRKECVPTP